uniref:Receptor-like serine/threonine-protein kinase n=1 Tax=Cannabis sativa TaxID=3483 RepID=A0A803NJ28_CANSA
MASIYFLMLLLITAKFSISTAQEKISLGSSLSPNTNNSNWLSSSGLFAFGFYKTQSNGFAVGIWYEKLNQKTVVWTANPDDPPLSHDVTLLFSDNGSIVLQDKKGVVKAIIANSSQPAATASMLDSGNFVLYNLDSTIAWQSFDHQADTLLPGQPLLPGNQLVSADKRFRLAMQGDGKLVQYPATSPSRPFFSYWESNINNKTVDTNSGWGVKWASVGNKCAPIGLCGLNSYCVLTDQDGEQDCACPPGFDFVDKQSRNLGCQRNTSIDCIAQSQNDHHNHDEDSHFSFVELDGIVWSNDDSYSANTAINKSACKDECLKDCNCQAVLFRKNNNRCVKLTTPLRYSRIRREDLLTTIIKVRTTSFSGKDRANDHHQQAVKSGIFITGMVVSSLGIIGLVISGVLIYRFRTLYYQRIGNLDHDKFFDDVSLRPYTFGELEKATNGFKDQVGRGAFGTVFKGVITSNSWRTSKVVAIKRLERVIADGEREFRNEMTVIGKTHHRNLVKLHGYCHEGSNRLLVYEYMKNGSLADFLFNSKTRKPNWEERIGIALDIAKGIVYLHEECETQIIHCDIKPENILMDDQNSAKIADFGLAKLLMPDQTRTYTGLRGTRGYLAPEWHRNMAITVKADVYSFGIMVLEIVCCRRSMQMDVPEEKVVLANWVYECFMYGQLERLNSTLRPTMKKVCLMLEGIIDIPAPPNPISYSG